MHTIVLYSKFHGTTLIFEAAIMLKYRRQRLRMDGLSKILFQFSESVKSDDRISCDCQTYHLINSKQTSNDKLVQP